jgi:predicted DNA-binding ribbon-helix-helix protein
MAEDGAARAMAGNGLGDKGHEIIHRQALHRSGGHKTSVSLEEPFYQAVKDIAASRRVTLSDLIARIDTDCEHGNLSSAIRLFVLDHYQAGTASPNRSFVASDQHHAAH